MLKNLFVYVKYPSVAGIIGVVWIGSSVLMLRDTGLPILRMVIINMLASFLIAIIGFRVDKK